MSTNPVPPIAPNSTQPGFLQPTNLYGGLEDRDLARFIQQMVAGITGLDPTLVRPEWQPEPPDEPDFNVTWCAVRKERRDPETFAWEGNVMSDNNTVDHVVIRHELLPLRASFQGPAAEATCERLSMGFQLAQNREYLTRAGYGLVETEQIIIIPVFRNERWLYVADMPFTLRRRQQYGYPVEAVNASEVELVIDEPAYTKTFEVVPAP